MSWKNLRDDLKSDVPASLNEKRISIKQSDGKAYFVYYDKELKENLAVPEIEGVILGTAMSISSFDTNYGKNGSTWNSHYIFDFDKVRIFAPNGDKQPIMKYQEAIDWLGKETKATVKKRTVYFVLTHEGILAVYTNPTIAIEQLSKTEWRYSVVKLTPLIYNPGTAKLSKKAVDYLGKLANTNPPLYADLTVSQPITDDYANVIGLEQYQKMFNHVKDFYGKTTADVVEAETNDYTQEIQDYQRPAPGFQHEIKPQSDHGLSDDDLPF